METNGFCPTCGAPAYLGFTEVDCDCCRELARGDHLYTGAREKLSGPMGSLERTWVCGGGPDPMEHPVREEAIALANRQLEQDIIRRHKARHRISEPHAKELAPEYTQPRVPKVGTPDGVYRFTRKVVVNGCAAVAEEQVRFVGGWSQRTRPARRIEHYRREGWDVEGPL
jgi:hypothetical protein